MPGKANYFAKLRSTELSVNRQTLHALRVLAKYRDRLARRQPVTPPTTPPTTPDATAAEPTGGA